MATLGGGKYIIDIKKGFLHNKIGDEVEITQTSIFLIWRDRNEKQIRNCLHNELKYILNVHLYFHAPAYFHEIL